MVSAKWTILYSRTQRGSRSKSLVETIPHFSRQKNRFVGWISSSERFLFRLLQQSQRLTDSDWTQLPTTESHGICTRNLFWNIQNVRFTKQKSPIGACLGFRFWWQREHVWQPFFPTPCVLKWRPDAWQVELFADINRHFRCVSKNIQQPTTTKQVSSVRFGQWIGKSDVLKKGIRDSRCLGISRCCCRSGMKARVSCSGSLGWSQGLVQRVGGRWWIWEVMFWERWGVLT